MNDYDDYDEGDTEAAPVFLGGIIHRVDYTMDIRAAPVTILGTPGEADIYVCWPVEIWSKRDTQAEAVLDPDAVRIPGRATGEVTCKQLIVADDSPLGKYLREPLSVSRTLPVDLDPSIKLAVEGMDRCIVSGFTGITAVPGLSVIDDLRLVFVPTRKGSDGEPESSGDHGDQRQPVAA